MNSSGGEKEVFAAGVYLFDGEAVSTTSLLQAEGTYAQLSLDPSGQQAAFLADLDQALVGQQKVVDLVVAARDAYVSVAYVKIGLTPDGGVTASLGRALPRQLVTEMVMTGDRIGSPA